MIMDELQYKHYIDLLPEEGDSLAFGCCIVANEKYLAVGDIGAERIIIYQYSSQQKWTRFRAISLPTSTSNPNHIIYKIALTGDTLVIGEVKFKRECYGEEQLLYPYQPAKRKDGQTRPPYGSSGLSYTGAVYRTLMTSNFPLERIDTPKTGEFAGFSVAACRDNIAFSVATYGNPGKSSGYTNLISSGHTHIFAASGLIALSDSLLIVGINTGIDKGEISIFDLTVSNPDPRIVEIPNEIIEVTLTEKIIAVRAVSSSGFQETLIIDIDSLAIDSLDGSGNISTYKNYLVCGHPTTPDHEVLGNLKLFDIGRASPKLIFSNNAEVFRSFITKDFLFAVMPHDSDKKRICILSYI